MSLVSFTCCVRAVCPASKVVFQQLVRPCGTGSSHQPHCRLMKKHLQKNTQTQTHTHTHTHTSEPQQLLSSRSAGVGWSRKTHHFTPHMEHFPGYKQDKSVESEYFSVFGLTTEPHKMLHFMWLSEFCTSQNITNEPTAVKAVVVKDPPATVMTSTVNLTRMTDDTLNCGFCSCLE